MLLKPGLTFRSIRHSHTEAFWRRAACSRACRNTKAGPSGPSPSLAAQEPGTGQSSPCRKQRAGHTRKFLPGRRAAPATPAQGRKKVKSSPPLASWSQASWWKSRGSHQRCTAPARGLICLQNYLISSQTTSAPHGHRLQRKSPVNSSRLQ